MLIANYKSHVVPLSIRGSWNVMLSLGYHILGHGEIRICSLLVIKMGGGKGNVWQNLETMSNEEQMKDLEMINLTKRRQSEDMVTLLRYLKKLSSRTGSSVWSILLPEGKLRSMIKSRQKQVLPTQKKEKEIRTYQQWQERVNSLLSDIEVPKARWHNQTLGSLQSRVSNSLHSK